MLQRNSDDINREIMVSGKTTIGMSYTVGASLQPTQNDKLVAEVLLQYLRKNMARSM